MVWVAISTCPPRYHISFSLFPRLLHRLRAPDPSLQEQGSGGGDATKYDIHHRAHLQFGMSVLSPCFPSSAPLLILIAPPRSDI
jgi:hypothetical protein